MSRCLRLRSAGIALGAAILLTLPACSLFRSKTASAPPPPPPVLAAPEPAGPLPPSLPKDAQLADDAALKELVPGKSTKAEVKARFGIPREVIFSPGSETFLYYRDRTTGLFTRTTSRVEMLTVRFDGQGLLKDFEYRHSGD